MKFPWAFLYFGRLWRDFQLDAIVQTTYTPGYSWFNMIKRAWAPLSWRLVGVNLPITLAVKSVPPWLQKGLSADVLLEREQVVFINSLEVLNSYWNGTHYDGHDFFSSSVEYKDHPTPYDDQAEEVDTYLKAGVREHEASPGLKKFREEMAFLSRHSVVRTNAIEFYHCRDGKCSHCTK